MTKHEKTIYRLLRIIALARRYLYVEAEMNVQAEKDVGRETSKKWIKLAKKKHRLYSKLITEMRNNHIAF